MSLMRLGHALDPQKILALSRLGIPSAVFFGVDVSLVGKRMTCFALRGMKCAAPGCKRSGAAFFVERHREQPGGWHLNLYVRTGRGYHVMMTRDHILARADGGRDGQENSQPMCADCNVKKGSEKSRAAARSAFDVKFVRLMARTASQTNGVLSGSSRSDGPPGTNPAGPVDLSVSCSTAEESVVR